MTTTDCSTAVALSCPPPRVTAASPRYRIRPDLHVSFQESSGRPFYLVEDRLANQFYRLGDLEWKFASMFDGNRTMRQVAERLACDPKLTELDVSRASALTNWLLQTRLLVPAIAQDDSPVEIAPPQGTNYRHENRRPLPLRRHSAVAPRAPLASPRVAFSPFFIKFPLIKPDRLLSRLLPWLSFLTSGPAFLIWLVLCAVATYRVAGQWDQFIASAAVYLSPRTWLWLAAVWVVLKIIHETFHGIVCKKYGGYVNESGLVLILFSPVAYVDVTSSWRFRNRWHRIFTSAAGMYAEFAIAAVAGIVWSQSAEGTINYLCHSIVLTASVTTLIFNANPLMRFDGYYILSDILDIQNLYPLGRQTVRALWRTWVLKLPTPLPYLQGWKRIVVPCYGMATAVWRVLVCASLTIGAANLFHGAGMVLAVFAVFTWGALPLFQFVRNIMSADVPNRPDRKRLVKVALLLLFSVAVIALLPRPGGTTVPAIVAYSNQEIVRAETRGFVQQI
ncbi:MAG: hypothetical protein KDA60_20235, partial [Planctomycetales bacterium]|nr:hypothetical protein [Planctomycetales bacterium]